MARETRIGYGCGDAFDVRWGGVFQWGDGAGSFTLPYCEGVYDFEHENSLYQPLSFRVSRVL